MNSKNISFDIRISDLVRTLILITIFLIVSYIVLQILDNSIGGYYIENIYPFFDLSDERNLSTFYAVFLLALSSLLLYIISGLYRKNEQNGKPWLILSVIFLFMAADESIGLHEKIGALFKRLIGSSNLPDYLQYGWVLPYLVLLVVLGIYFARFFLNLDRRTLSRFSVAFIVFVTGAAGFEMIESKFHQMYGTYHLMYKVFVTIEETMEMLGTILFIRALLLHIAENFHEIGFVLKGDSK